MKIESFIGKRYREFIKTYIAKADAIIIPVVSTKEMPLWTKGKTIELITAKELNLHGYIFDISEYERLVKISLSYWEFSRLMDRFDSVEAFLNEFNLNGYILLSKEQMIVAVSREYGIISAL